MALPSRIHLEIVAPDRQLLSEDVDEVTIPGSEGYLGILPGHLPLLTTVGIGVLSFHRLGKRYFMSIAGGFAEVLPDRVIVMAQTVELPEEIDVSRAALAKDRAEKQLFARDQIDVELTMAALLRAVTRIRVSEIGK